MQQKHVKCRQGQNADEPIRSFHNIWLPIQQVMWFEITILILDFFF